MRALVFAVLASATLASVAPASASADQLAYAWWYLRSGSKVTDVTITAQEWSDGSHSLKVEIDRYDWKLRDPVVESLRCYPDPDSVSFIRPLPGLAEIPFRTVMCQDQHGGYHWKFLDLGVDWKLKVDEQGQLKVSAEANIRTRDDFVYVSPDDEPSSAYVTGY
jgi:hypothetical protein